MKSHPMIKSVSSDQHRTVMVMSLSTVDEKGHEADCTWAQLRDDLDGEGYSQSFLACAEQDLADGKELIIGGGVSPTIIVKRKGA